MKLQNMEFNGDFMQWLGPDMSVKVLMHLDDPCDYVRVSAVSRPWRHFVIANGICKQLCLRKFPELCSLAHIKVSDVIEPVTVGHSCSIEWESLKRDHRVYSFLAQGLTPVVSKDCISRAICASSTDNYPEESIRNTLEERDRIEDRVEDRASYWSSKGAIDSSVPETLLYKLKANLCIVTEISIQPFQAYFQYGFPIYSAKAVRFRTGHTRFPMELDSEAAGEFAPGQNNVQEKFVWTYTSPEFPMAQENHLQKFKLPEPVLCVGGILLVELLGRVQTQEMDGLYYICISHVQVAGRALTLPFDVELLDLGKCSLKYCHESESCPSNGAVAVPSRLRSLTARLMQGGARGWEQVILNRFLGAGAAAHDDGSDDEHSG